jgi:hypothetical protein
MIDHCTTATTGSAPTWTAKPLKELLGEMKDILYSPQCPFRNAMLAKDMPPEKGYICYVNTNDFAGYHLPHYVKAHHLVNPGSMLFCADMSNPIYSPLEMRA